MILKRKVVQRGFGHEATALTRAGSGVMTREDQCLDLSSDIVERQDRFREQEVQECLRRLILAQQCLIQMLLYRCSVMIVHFPVTA